jgi:uncharacterized RDD family membrane protein YckC
VSSAPTATRGPAGAGSPAPEALEYVGFWLRVLAALVDTIWVTPIIVLLGLVYQNASSSLTDALVLDPAGVSVAALAKALAPTPADFVVQYLLPAVLIVLFWRRRSATPGKMLIHARIVDARTGSAPTLRQLVIRYVGYYVSIVPLLLGLFWVGWDPRKQGWHDKLAGTVVVRPKDRQVSVTFPPQDQR